MPLNDVGSYTLGEVNIALLAGVGLLNPLLLQLDLFITGQFGLGPFLADIQVQFNAAISLQLQLSFSISSPFRTLSAQPVWRIHRSCHSTCPFAHGYIGTNQRVLDINGNSLQISAQIAAMASLQATLAFKLGGIRALLAAGLAVKIPALRFVAQMNAALSAGPVHVLSFTGDMLAVTGADIAAAFASGLGPNDPILPTEQVSGVIILTKDPAVFAALGGIIKVN